MEAITRSEWRKLHKDYKTGTIRAGDTKMLKYDPKTGTALVPVVVVKDDGQKWPVTAHGRTLWACCVSAIGPKCEHVS